MTSAAAAAAGMLLLLHFHRCRCRQKTLEDHVTCTNANCGNGKRMPLSFW
jgi:hypothetical protein